MIVLADMLELSQESIVMRSGVQPFLLDAAQHAHWVVQSLFPQIAIQPHEQFEQLVVPCPQHIVSQIP
jgi:hypothetical protein